MVRLGTHPSQQRERESYLPSLFFTSEVQIVNRRRFFLYAHSIGGLWWKCAVDKTCKAFFFLLFFLFKFFFKHFNWCWMVPPQTLCRSTNPWWWSTRSLLPRSSRTTCFTLWLIKESNNKILATAGRKVFVSKWEQMRFWHWTVRTVFIADDDNLIRNHVVMYWCG